MDSQSAASSMVAAASAWLLDLKLSTSPSRPPPSSAWYSPSSSASAAPSSGSPAAGPSRRPSLSAALPWPASAHAQGRGVLRLSQDQDRVAAAPGAPPAGGGGGA